MSVALVRRLGGVLAAALVLSVPVVAVSVLPTNAGNPAVAIAAEDQASASGVEAVKAPVAQNAPAVVRDQDDADAVVLLRNWTYTGKPKPSPGH
jgi:hypothetical protein